MRNICNADKVYWLPRWFRNDPPFLCPSGQDIDNLMEGLQALTKGIQEVGINTTAVAVLQMASAAALWPNTAFFIAVRAGHLTPHSNCCIC